MTVYGSTFGGSKLPHGEAKVQEAPESTTAIDDTPETGLKLYSVKRVIAVDGESKINETMVYAVDPDHAIEVSQDHSLPPIVVEFIVEEARHDIVC